MPGKYGPKAEEKVERAMHERPVQPVVDDRLLERERVRAGPRWRRHRRRCRQQGGREDEPECRAMPLRHATTLRAGTRPAHRAAALPPEDHPPD